MYNYVSHPGPRGDEIISVVEGAAGDLRAVTMEHLGRLSLLAVPDPQSAIVTPAADREGLGREREGGDGTGLASR